MSKSTINLTLLLALICSILKAQNNPVIKGYVTGSNHTDTLAGAIIRLKPQKAVAANERGFYSVETEPGEYTVSCSYTGYKTVSRKIAVSNEETIDLNFELDDANTALDEVVVSAGKYEQKLSDVTVSMDIIKTSLIENKNTTSLEFIMNQVPGVTVADGQASIRGGSGFSYGAGSRVLMLVDEMPMISADAGDIKWNYLPLENLEQVEVIKGASSALFGSSALNGVINLRTAYAKDKPITKLTTFFGSYDAPRHNYKWWKGSSQHQSGINFSHAQKLKQFDLVVGGHMFNDDGFRMLETESRKRFNSNIRYNSKIEGLSMGVNTNMMNTQGGLFFLWQHYDSAYIPSGRTIQRYNNFRFNIDPYVTYFKGSNKFSLRNRYFKTVNNNDKNQSSTAELYYSELQYQKRFGNNLNVTGGVVYMEQQILGDSLYGRHTGKNIAGYLQADKKFFEKLTVSAGLRGEFYRIDTAETKGYLIPGKKQVELPFQPVMRVGLNYQAFEYTFIRASFGQGYRFPSVAEKFVSTSVSALQIYPNPSLQPERAYSAELGIKQGFGIKNFKGFLDLAGFYTEYSNMIEFVFDIYAPGGKPTGLFFLDLPYAGFKSQNIGTARITGGEASLTGTGKIGPVNITMLSGYTYINPVKPDFNPLIDTLGLPGIKTLKYRNKHLLKNDIQLDYKFISIGYSCRFQSKTENIDRRFIQSILHEYNDIANGTNWDEIDETFILPGLKQNFPAFQKSFWVHDARLSFNLNANLKLSFIVNNFTNEEYQNRPGDMRPPTQYVGQLSIKL